MSSDSKIKFTTSASSKGAGATVTSETVTMPDHSENHILNVKADSSCSGEVDVQLEMSPDGSNWCPAVTRTVSTSAGTTTAAREGNQEYVKLTPDAGEYKNKHCRGGLNFNTAGAVVTPDGSGTRDLMHQHIATTKSFNYSQWFKTTENPTTTYKPVLFRHGGYDDFSNAKTVELGTGIGHLNSSYLKGAAIHELGGLYKETSGGLMSEGTTNNNYGTDPVTINFWAYIPSTIGASEATLVGDHTGNSTGRSIFINSSKQLVLYSNNVLDYRYAGFTLENQYLDQWIMITVVLDSNTITNAKFYIQNSTTTNTTQIPVTITSGSTITTYPDNGSTINHTGFLGCRTYNNAKYPAAASVSSTEFKIDEYTAWSKALSSSEITALHNNHKVFDYSTHSANSDLFRYIRFGDVTGDSNNTVNCKIDSNFDLAKDSGSSGTYINSLTGVDDVFAAPASQNLCTLVKNEHAVKVEDQSYAGTTNTINVTVANNGTSNKFYVDGVTLTGKLRLAEGTTYKFDQSDSSNATHPLRFSTTSDGSHGGGSEYTTGVTTNGTPGSAGAYTQIVVASSAPTLYIYCTAHSGMGGEVDTVAVMKRPGLKLSNASGTFINPFKKSTDSNSNTLPVIETADIANNDELGITVSANVKITGPLTGTNYNVKRLWTIFFEDSNGNPKGAISTLFSKNNPNIFNMYYDENWNQIAYYGTAYGSAWNSSDWNHISANFFKKPSGTAHQQAYYSRISINGSTPPQGYSSSGNISFQDYGGLVVSKVELGGGDDWDSDIEFDNLCFLTGWLNTNTNWTDLYNARKNPLSFSSANMELKSCFTMGDGVDDKSNHIYKDIVEPSSGRQFVKNDSISAPVSVTLTTTDDPYDIQIGGQMSNVFDVNINASISGWFKTTDTGILFSNSSNGTDGLLFDIQSSVYQLKFGSVSTIQAASSGIRDGEWHHLVITKAAKDGSNLSETKIYIDGTLASTTSVGSTLANSDLRGSNGFTLLGNGENNFTTSSPSPIDDTQLNATLSNWSLHSQVLDINAVKQLYSNGHVRNIKNLPNVNPANIISWWQLADASNPQNDLIGSHNLTFYDGANVAQNLKAVQASTSTTSGDSDFIAGNASLFGGQTLPAYNGAWSLSFWVNIPSNGSSFDSIITQYDGNETQKHFKIFQLSGNLTFSMAYDENGLDLSVPFTTYNTWKHVVISKSAGEPGTSTVAIYIDGVAQTVSATYNDNTPARGSTDNWNSTNASFIRLFAHSWSYSVHGATAGSRTGRVFKLDELAGYSKALSSSEASAIYNSGNFINLKTLASSYNLESYYRFGDAVNDVSSGTICIRDQIDLQGQFKVEDSNNQAIFNLSASDPNYKLISANDLTTKLVNATGATYVNGSINGNAMTMSLTKSFNFSTSKWVSTADQDLALCLSFNGFEEQAEYFAIWKCSQTVAGSTINICDGGWHNVILSYRGRNNLSGDNVDPGDTVKFGPGPADSLPYNWCLSFDGQPLTSINDGSGVDYIGGLNTIVTATYNATSYNVGFAIQDRHLKYISTNSEEVYKPHAQFSSGIHEVVGVDNNNAFQGSVDETSFHSDTWWVDGAGTSVTTLLNAEKPATIYGNTTALGNRQGASTDYPEGKPYDLLHPERLTTGGQASDIEGTNQYINPNRYDSATNPNGGLEGWWRWGDTPGDCSITINDVKDHNDSINARDISAFGIVTADRVDMSAQGSPESIYVADRASSTTPGGASITFPQVIVENIQTGICNLRQMASPVLKYLRVKFTGAGTCNLGENSVQAQINFEIKD